MQPAIPRGTGPRNEWGDYGGVRSICSCSIRATFLHGLFQCRISSDAHGIHIVVTCNLENNPAYDLHSLSEGGYPMLFRNQVLYNILYVHTSSATTIIAINPMSPQVVVQTDVQPTEPQHETGMNLELLTKVSKRASQAVTTLRFLAEAKPPGHAMHTSEDWKKTRC